MRQPEPAEVKRYAQSRLYFADGGRYLTVEDLRNWQATGVPFRVTEAETGEDITRALLA